MPIEYEVKLAGDLDALRSALQAAGAVSEGRRVLEDDLVLDTRQDRLRRAGELLRLRRRGDRYLLTFKGCRQPDAGHKARLEVQTAVDDGPATLALLERLGFVVARRYQKYRTTFRCPADGCDRVVVTLDETPIGAFLEIEGAPQDIDRCAAVLGFDKSAYETRSYLEIHRARGGSGDMVFPGAASGPWLGRHKGKGAA